MKIKRKADLKSAKQANRRKGKENQELRGRKKSQNIELI
jgi:hypothetical protein